MKLLLFARKIFGVVMSCCGKGSKRDVIVVITLNAVILDSNIRNPEVATSFRPNIDLCREVCVNNEFIHCSDCNRIINICLATSTTDITSDLSESVDTLCPKAPRFISLDPSSKIVDWEELKKQIRS